MTGRLGLKGTLLAFLALVVLATQGTSYLTTWSLLESVVQAGQRDRVHMVGSVLESFILAQTTRLRDAARLLSASDRLAAALAASGEAAAPELVAILDEHRHSIKLDLLEVADRRGVVLYRAHDPGRRGGQARSWGVSEALGGTASLVSSRDQQTVVIQAIEPVRRNGAIVGTVAAGLGLNAPFIESLARTVGARLVLMSRQGVVVASHAEAQRRLDAAAVTEAFYEKIPIFRADSSSRTTTVYMPVLIVDEAYVMVAQIDSSRAYALLGATGARSAAVAVVILLAASLVGLGVFSWLLAPLRRLRKRAEETALVVTGTPIAGGARGEIASAVHVLDTLTERLLLRNRELAEASVAAEGASRAKSDFLSHMSHEIRTPLNGVLGMAELLQQTPLDHTQARYCRAIATSGRALHGLLSDILDLAKIEAGKLQVETCVFAPRSLLQEIAETYLQLAGAKGISLVADLDRSVPDAVAGDPTRLRQVLINLLGNAVKFTPPGGRITLGLRSLGRPQPPGRCSLGFAVCDTGIGMDPETVRALGQPFTQGHPSISRTHGGTGLGLAISKALIERMGGSLRITSAPGEGTAMSFELPFETAATPAAPPEAAAPSPLAPAPFAAHVLVAEDNVVNQEVILAMLSRLGASATLVENGAAAVEAAQGATFDVVLMDCEMPGVDGYEATARIRAAEPGPRRLPIIALTANALAEDRQRCLAAGMDDYLAKPITFERLAVMLRRWAGPQCPPVLAGRHPESAVAGVRSYQAPADPPDSAA